MIEQVVWKFRNPNRITEIAVIGRKLFSMITGSGRKFEQCTLIAAQDLLAGL